jgi:sugar phosphate isomerase/epimerase
MLSLNQATSRTTGTAELLAACRDAGIGQVSLWRDQYVDGDPAATRKVADDCGLRVSSLCRGGFFTGTRPEREAAEDNRRAVAEAAELGAPLLVLVCGPVTGDGFAAAEAAIERGIERLLPAARDAGVTLAVEPFHPMLAAERSAIVTLEQAVRLVSRLGDPAVAIALDTYHVWWDPRLAASVAAAGDRIAAVHVADWLVPTPDLLAGRGLPGDGLIDLAGLLALVRATGFAGPVEVEVLNPAVWARPVGELLPEIVHRMRALLPDPAVPGRPAGPGVRA